MNDNIGQNSDTEPELEGSLFVKDTVFNVDSILQVYDGISKKMIGSARISGVLSLDISILKNNPASFDIEVENNITKVFLTGTIKDNEINGIVLLE